MKIWSVSVAFGVFGTIASPANASTITAASCSYSAVAAAVTSASHGDTVAIPAGTCKWDATLVVTKAITLQGAGVGRTVIQDGVIGDKALVDLTLVANLVTRLTGVEFRDGGIGGINYNGIIVVRGANSDSRRVRIDHCQFDHLDGTQVFLSDALGVVDHNNFVSVGRIPIYVYHANWDGVPYSAGSWSASTSLGSERFVFIEDNTFTFPTKPYAVTDAYRGARYVARRNRITNGWIELHGTDSAGRLRGTRAVEIYGNEFLCTLQCFWVANFRSGTGVVYDNTVTGFTDPGIMLAAYRSFWPFAPFGAADGTNPWDVNEPGGPFLTAVASGGSMTSVVVSGANWTADQWVGYSIKKTSSCASVQCASIIVSNTADTITFTGDNGFAFGNTSRRLAFSSGDSFALYRVKEALDQPGRSGGSLLTAELPLVPAGWNNQVDDPIYVWGNSAHIRISATQPFIRRNEHYFENTPKPGYVPFTYPHPLTAGTVSAPRNVRIVP